MQRSHVGAGGLDHGGIPRIGLQMIKILQVPTCPVGEETEELLKEGPERQALGAFAEMAKGLLHEWCDLDL
ncbi:MAG: hypothetical protein ABI618_02225 [Nitrospirota bacterium]